MGRPKNSELPTTQAYVTLFEWQVEKLKRYTDKTKVSRNAFLQELLTYALERLDVENCSLGYTAYKKEDKADDTIQSGERDDRSHYEGCVDVEYTDE